MFKKKNKTEDSSGALKKKALVCSSEAAAISIGIHVLLILFAGSIVAIKYVQKRDASFSGENIVRPKLERRQLQMPQKVQNLQKKSSRPKVTSRMATASQSSFSLPDMMGMGDIGGGFDRGGSGERTLSSMGAAGSLGFGISGINFFGAKSKGEKIVFVVDASVHMLDDRRGGYFTYKYAKERIYEMIDGMRSATLFNLIVYAKKDVRVFQSNLVPATPQNRDAVKQWFAPVNASDDVGGKINYLSGTYTPEIEYEDSPIPSSQLSGLMRSIQAAMEQKADNIFILCPNWHICYLAEEETLRRNGFDSKEDFWESRGWDAERVAEWQSKRQEYAKTANEQLEKENRAREENGLPKKFVNDKVNYAVHELGLPNLNRPPQISKVFSDGNGYGSSEVIECLEAVIDYNYRPQKLDDPKIHIVKLIAEDGDEIGGQDEWWTWTHEVLVSIPRAFDGNMEYLRGSKTMENLLKYN